MVLRKVIRERFATCGMIGDKNPVLRKTQSRVNSETAFPKLCVQCLVFKLGNSSFYLSQRKDTKDGLQISPSNSFSQADLSFSTYEILLSVIYLVYTRMKPRNDEISSMSSYVSRCSARVAHFITKFAVSHTPVLQLLRPYPVILYYWMKKRNTPRSHTPR